MDLLQFEPELCRKPGDGADPGPYLVLGRMAITGQARPPARELRACPLGPAGLDLRLHGLRQTLGAASPRHLRQGIGDLVGPTKPDDAALFKDTSASIAREM